MSETVNMHYVPRTYLKHFSREEVKPKGSEYFIKALDTKTAIIKELNIKNVCSSKNIYTLEGDTEFDRQFIEGMYGDLFEREYDKLYDILTNDKIVNIEKEHRQMVVASVVSMFYRNKAWNDVYDDHHVKIYDRNFFEKVGIDIDDEKLKRFHKFFGEYRKPEAARASVERAFFLSTAKTFTDQITVVKLTDEFEFVTSDNPVNFKSKPGINLGPMDAFNTLSLALDTKHIVILQPTIGDRNIIVRPAKSPALSAHYVQLHNQQQSLHSIKFIFGSENALKRFRLP